MNQYGNPYMNPYGMQPTYQPYTAGPVMQVTRVNGENGAKSYQLGPNSSAMLLDESGLIVWLVTSDGAGYKTVMAYDIVPHQEEPKPDWNALDKRITKLEGLINATADTSTVRKKPGKPGDGED